MDNYNSLQFIQNSSFRNILFKLKFHVQTFLIILFYFMYNNLKERNINKIKQRFELLLIVYFVYPYINNLLFILFNKGTFNKKLTLNNLITQLIFVINIHDIL